MRIYWKKRYRFYVFTWRINKETRRETIKLNELIIKGTRKQNISWSLYNKFQQMKICADKNMSTKKRQWEKYGSTWYQKRKDEQTKTRLENSIALIRFSTCAARAQVKNNNGNIFLNLESLWINVVTKFLFAEFLACLNILNFL